MTVGAFTFILNEMLSDKDAIKGCHFKKKKKKTSCEKNGWHKM